MLSFCTLLMEVYKGVEQPPTLEQGSRIPKNHVSGNSSMVSLQKNSWKNPAKELSRKSVKKHQRTMRRKSTVEVIRSKDVPALFVLWFSWVSLELITIEWASAQVPPTPLIGGGYCREREGDGQQDRHMAVCFSSLWPCRRFCVRAWRLLGYLLHRSWADFWRSWKVWRV